MIKVLEEAIEKVKAPPREKQEYAAFVAAEFAIEFLRREWASLWPTI